MHALQLYDEAHYEENRVAVLLLASRGPGIIGVYFQTASKSTNWIAALLERSSCLISATRFL